MPTTHNSVLRTFLKLLLMALPLCVLFAVTLIARAADAPMFASNSVTAPAAVTWTNFIPSGWVTAKPVGSQVTAHAAGGLETATAQYATSTDGGASWSPWDGAGLTTSGALSTTQTLSVSGLNLADSAAANLIRYRIQETGGALEVSPHYTLRVDTVAPVSQVSQPAPNAVLQVAPAIQGNASDATAGVSQVQVTLYDATASLYWSGAGWVGAEQWLGTTLNGATWTYTGSQPVWANGITYVVRSRATDRAGLIETPAVGVSFSIDAIAPSVTVNTPNGGEVWAGGQTQTIKWQASDNLGLTTNPITLSVSYDGGAVWSFIATNQPNTGSYAWAAPTIDSSQVLVQVEAVDRAGNRTADRSNAVFALDSNAPGAPENLAVTPDTWSSVANFTVTWTIPPGLGTVTGSWYKLDTPPTAPNDGTFVPSSTVITGITPAVDGAHPIYVWLQDQFGRADPDSAATGMLYLDRVAPAAPFSLKASPARTWTNINSFSEQWTNPSDLSGIVGAYYQLNRPGAFPTDGIYAAAVNSLNGISVPGDGKYDLYIWLVDAAGNVSHENRNIDPQAYWYDSRSPASTATLTPAPSASGWYTNTVSVTFSATDATGGSGVNAIYSKLDNGPWETLSTRQITTEGVHQLARYAQDIAGNLETTNYLTVSVDFSPPAVSLTPVRPPQPSGWYTSSVSLVLATSDAISAPAVGYYRLNGGGWQSGTQVQLSTSGQHKVEYYGQDRAGNRSTVQSYQAQVDLEPPATAYMIEGIQGQNNWYTSALNIELVPTDDASGVAATYYRINAGAWQAGTQFSLTENGIYTASFYSVDRAGNVETSFPVEIKVDKNAPVAPTAVTTTPAEWSRTNSFTVQWANPTDLSSISAVYYRLNQEPVNPTDGELLPVTNRITHLTVPTQGAHRLYLWLRDGAGNADHRNRVIAPLLRYDSTPPTTTHTIQGLAGDDGWYRSPLTVTLTAQDSHSGVAFLRYRLNSGDWITTTSAIAHVAITTPGKYAFEFAAQDVAGNLEAGKQVTVRLDPDAPSAPLNLTVAPSGWQQDNAFELTWRAPLDQSGIAGVYVRFNSPPTGPTAGTFYTAEERLTGLQAPGEGQHTLYVWLRDRAGNVDHNTAVALVDVLRYDATPPATIVNPTGSLGAHGWYVGPVQFQLGATDAASGLAELRHRVDGGPWQPGTTFTVSQEGRHTIEVSAVDAAGNVEPAQRLEVAIDRQDPLAGIGLLSHYQPAPEFEVRWWGFDPLPGAGVDRMDVQFRDGYAAAWQNWQTDTNQTHAAFAGQRGHTYFFRARARDLAGHVGPWSEAAAYAVVETVRNGRFDTGTFSEWEIGGSLYMAVVPYTTPAGSSFVARLGTEDYGPSLGGPNVPGTVPVSNATITQTVQIPPLNQVPAPTLAFRYRVFSWDVIYSDYWDRIQDTFEVWVYPQSGEPVELLYDGNPTGKYGKELTEPYDTGWQHAFIDMTRFAGQTVRITFAIHNRYDNLFNTWGYVDDIQLQGLPYSYRYLMPVVASVAGGPAAGAGPEAAIPTVGAEDLPSTAHDGSEPLR